MLKQNCRKNEEKNVKSFSWLWGENGYYSKQLLCVDLMSMLLTIVKPKIVNEKILLCKSDLKITFKSSVFKE